LKLIEFFPLESTTDSSTILPQIQQTTLFTSKDNILNTHNSFVFIYIHLDVVEDIADLIDYNTSESIDIIQDINIPSVIEDSVGKMSNILCI